jgi:hypothetical protein
MSIRFAIKNTASKAEKEGDVFIRYSGTAEPFRRVSDREANKIGIDANGDSKLAFTTGLDTEKVKFFKWYNEDEQEQLAKAIEDLRPGIIQFYGGVDIVNPHNRFFWGENRDVARLSLSHDDIDVFYDTKSPVHALGHSLTLLLLLKTGQKDISFLTTWFWKQKTTMRMRMKSQDQMHMLLLVN